MLRYLIVFICVFFFAGNAFSEIIFQDDFDACTNDCVNGVTRPTPSPWMQWERTIPYSATQDGVTKYAGEISSPGRGGSGKSLKIWRHSTFSINAYNGTLWSPPVSGYSDIYMRFYMRVPQDMDLSGSNYLKLFRLDTSTDDLYININMAADSSIRQTGQLQYRHNGDTLTLLTTEQLMPLLDGNWHAWQFRFNLAGGSVTLWIDGEERITLNNTGSSGTWNSYLGHFILGNTASGATWQNSWRAWEADDLVIATTKAETDPLESGPDTTPPSRSAGSPSGALSSGTTSTTMSLTTNETATCKWSTSAGTAYASMANTFSTTGGTTHSTTISGLSDGESYTRYVRCADDESTPNVNTDDYTISWTVSNPSTGITPGNLIFYESFSDNSWTARGWYDGTDSTGSTAGGYIGNGLRWAWSSSATKPTGFSTIRKQFTSQDKILVEYYTKFDTGWEGSGLSYHPHMIHLMSTDDTAYQSLSAAHNNLYLEAISDTSSPYTIRPMFGGQDTYRVNTGVGTVPNNLVGITEIRSAFSCNTPYTLTGATSGGCDNLGGGIYYSATSWRAQNVTIPMNEWVRVRYYIKKNTFTNNVANFDGIIRVWIGDTLAIEDTAMMYAANAHADTEWDKIVFAPYIGNGSPKNQTMWIDELKVYDGYSTGYSNGARARINTSGITPLRVGTTPITIPAQ
jgi:hypothetical protein